jgi:peptide/nickel transport system permease protein
VKINGWLSFVGWRLVALAVIVVGLVAAVFMMVRLIPGDPAAIAGGVNTTPAQIAALRQQMGLDEPILTQFSKYAIGLLHGDLGTSFTTRQPVTQVISERIGSSMTLAGVSLAIVLIFAVPAGLVAGALTREGRHQRGELIFTGTTSVVGAIPQFLAATFLAFVFAVWLKLLPVAGSDPPLQSLILPAASVALAPTATLARLVRVEALNVLAQDYVRTARSKRLPARIIYVRHVLPNVLTAALTIGGIILANLIGGAVIVENVYARNGLGTELVNAVLVRDYPVIQGTILILGIIVVVVNAIVDAGLALLDPRSLVRRR